ncbi:uncharacterized protein A1O5_02387 [Cladophialophora psammophila CBS 110553]|uniref:Uncharacterized protein n=1 Tax=Cladophialophora psammophila CBS 110553 TaxID=1182543 RepID=W9X1M1_9EURO|nr:uncharacterized protein A1O5_02387 [Cladophialophora psammophila CBS 110553]EXJ74093.1 hypothetical protein A1O5_02387 [Cladophialophora psammophila CBS 110553]
MSLLLGSWEPVYDDLYKDSMDPVEKDMLFRQMLPGNRDVLFLGTAKANQDSIAFKPEEQHLRYFAGGMFLLSGWLFSRPDHEYLERKTNTSVHLRL